MLNKKKNVTMVLQKQKYLISIPSEVWSEILRYFSRKQLCRKIHLVNRKLYDLASSRHNVPTIHVIYLTLFEAKRPLSFVNLFKSKRFNCVRFGHYGLKELETHQLRKMPIPGPYVRFEKVYIYRFLEESTLKFLCDAKESFTGSVIHYSMTYLLKKDLLNKQDLFNPSQNTPEYAKIWCIPE